MELKCYWCQTVHKWMSCFVCNMTVSCWICILFELISTHKCYRFKEYHVYTGVNLTKEPFLNICQIIAGSRNWMKISWQESWNWRTWHHYKSWRKTTCYKSGEIWEKILFNKMSSCHLIFQDLLDDPSLLCFYVLLYYDITQPLQTQTIHI